MMNHMHQQPAAALSVPNSLPKSSTEPESTGLIATDIFLSTLRCSHYHHFPAPKASGPQSGGIDQRTGRPIDPLSARAVLAVVSDPAAPVRLSYRRGNFSRIPAAVGFVRFFAPACVRLDGQRSGETDDRPSDASGNRFVCLDVISEFSRIPAMLGLVWHFDLARCARAVIDPFKRS
jgi:hypothetical protein